jgi:phosphoenolpyruvate carboxykinase (ATP)
MIMVFQLRRRLLRKMINLSEENEPDIWRAIRSPRFAARKTLRLTTKAKTSIMPIVRQLKYTCFIPDLFYQQIVLPSRAGHANKVIYLSADAFGVFAPGFHLG